MRIHLLALGAALMVSVGQATETSDDDVVAVIANARGVDRDVDYTALTRFGPWDDRNYALTRDDLALLSPEEHLLPDPIPAFFRVEFRKANPKMRRHGEAQYPLSALNAFNLRYGGYEIDGKIYKGIRRLDDGSYLYREDRETKAWKSWPKFVSGEVKVSTPNGAAESAIAINPVDTTPGSERLVAGTNGPGSGQKMWRSSDGGATWIASQPLTGGNTCCDPTVAWSTDGTKAYASALVSCTTSCGIRFYRSDDNGNLWGDNDNATPVPAPVTLVASGADKQFIHVDAHPSSPFKDRIYLCWHEGNIQKFGRSSDFGVSFTNTGTVDGNARSVGCDVTSDHTGAVYYFYPSLDAGDVATRRQIRVAKSTDGGASFAAAVTVAANQDSFNYPLPSMETRRVAKIVQADADTTGGPFNGSLYVIWPDLTAPESTAANNHSIVRVAYSRDGGATWQITSPHSLADTNSVDRYQPSIKVDRLGRVHAIFYDTRRSPDRTAVDVFYAVSYDGAATWTPARRVTTELSPNINDNFEFGDYSHMDGVIDNIIAIFTDNRDESGAGAQSIDAYAVAGFADTFTPGYVASVSPAALSVCATGSPEPLTVSIRGTGGFASPLTLGVATNPAVTSASFNPPTVTPGANTVTSQLTLGLAPNAVSPVDVVVNAGSAPTPNQPENRVRINLFQPLTNVPGSQTPVNSARGASTTPTFTWAPTAGAQAYRLEVATDPGFANIVATATTAGATSATLSSALAVDVRYYWRVRAENACGNGPYSGYRTFLTRTEYCVSPNLAIPDNNPTGVSSNLVVPPSAVGNITDLNVAVRLTHTYIGDLRLSVRPLSGTPNVQLINNPASCDGDDMNTTFDDESPTAFACVNNQVPAVGQASVRSLNLLSGLDGQPLAGTWQLFVADSATQDIGTLDRWCMVPDVASSDPGLFFDNYE